MSIFDNLDERIAQAHAEEEKFNQEYIYREGLYWEAQKSGVGKELAAIRERWALSDVSQASEKSHELEALKVIEPARYADIDSLKASLNEILRDAEGNENSAEIAERLNGWAKTIHPAFSFSQWGDAKTGTQGFFPEFHIHFPKGKWTPQMVQKINIFARALRRDFDYMVDFTTTKEGRKKNQHPQVLTVGGEWMHRAAVNYGGRLRHKWPKPLKRLTLAISEVSFHAGDSSFKK